MTAPTAFLLGLTLGSLGTGLLARVAVARIKRQLWNEWADDFRAVVRRADRADRELEQMRQFEVALQRARAPREERAN